MKNTIKNQEFINIGRKDKKYNYITKWPILNLDIKDPYGIWNTIQNRLKELDDTGKLEGMSKEKVNKFFLKRPELDFEINFFSDILNKCYMFKYNKKIYCYSYGTIKRKNGRRINVRFYFNINEALSLNLPI